MNSVDTSQKDEDNSSLTTEYHSNEENDADSSINSYFKMKNNSIINQHSRNRRVKSYKSEKVIEIADTNFLSPNHPIILPKLNFENEPKLSIALMSPKAAKESALLRKRLDKIHTQNKNRFKPKISKLQKKNQLKLRKFQEELLKIDKDPKSPMSRRRYPGNYIHTPIKGKLTSRQVTSLYSFIEQY